MKLLKRLWLKKQLAVVMEMIGTGIESPRNLCALMAEGEGDNPEVYKQMARAAMKKIDDALKQIEEMP